VSYGDRDRRGPSGLARLLVWAVCGAALIWCGALARFVFDLPRAVEDAQRDTDAIVVFTGGQARIAAGFAMLEQGRAQRLLISGVHPGTSKGDLQATAGVSTERLACCVDLGFVAADTSGNARETAAWVRERGFGSLRVVTASYHLPRSLIELRRRLPDVELVPHPVFPPQFKLEEWWTWPGTAALLFEEGNKYIVALARARIDDWTGGQLDDWTLSR